MGAAARVPDAGRPGRATRRLPVAGPFRLDLTAWALRRRARNRMDIWDGAYRRTLVIDSRPMSVTVTQPDRRDASFLRIVVESAAVDLTRSRVAEAIRLVGAMLGTGVDLGPFYRLARADPDLAPLAKAFRGLRPPRFPSLFEALANAVACQQLSLEVGIELLDRMTAAYGDVAAVPAGPRPFPRPEAVAELRPADLRALGFSVQKSRAIIGLAEADASGRIAAMDLDHLDDAAASAALQGLAGIGRWSAEYALLRGLGRLGVYPGDDVGARNKLRSFLGLAGSLDYEAIGRLTARWRPYAGMVYFHLLLDGLAARGQLSSAEG